MKNKLIRTLAVAVCFTMLAASAVFAAEIPSDVENSANEALKEAVSALMDAGAITGDEDGLFHPEENLTRAQVCSIIVKTINPNAAELTGTVTVNVPDSGFTDMRGYGWAASFINYAANNEIALGYADGTFKPGNDVTFAELVTFTVRACGYTDSNIGGTWPQNYLSKAEQLDLFADMGMVTETGATPADDPDAARAMKATKEMAAMIIFNAMEEIAEANAQEDRPQGTDKDEAAVIPNLSEFTFASGAFNSDINEYNGKALAKNVTVYVYGNKSEYKKNMEFSTKKEDYRETNIYKYKSVSTPAWYKLENGKIAEIVVPGDVGFSGRIYCVITGTNSKVINHADEAVTGLDTLTAGREITWFAKKNLEIPAVTDGQVYELYAKNGEIQQIAVPESADKREDAFVEITGGAFAEAEDYKDGLVQIDGKWYAIKDNAAVYVFEDDEYTVGRLSNIRNNKVRLYDISDDDESSVDIVVVEK